MGEHKHGLQCTTDCCQNAMSDVSLMVYQRAMGLSRDLRLKSQTRKAEQHARSGTYLRMGISFDRLRMAFSTTSYILLRWFPLWVLRPSNSWNAVIGAVGTGTPKGTGLLPHKSLTRPSR